MFRFILVILICAFQSVTGKHLHLSLQTAIETKKVKANVFSLGGHQGFCVKLVLDNLSKDSLVLIVEAGRRLNSIDNKYQDLLLVKDMIVGLKAGEVKHVTAKGYCCQMSNMSPAKGMAYDINKLADSNLVSLAKYLNANEFESGVEQHAIWAISNNRPVGAIASPSDSVSGPLRQFVAILKNEPLPWYTVTSASFLYSNGAIELFPMNVKGNINYTLDSEEFGILSIIDQNGFEVGSIKGSWLTAGTNQKYQIDIPVQGLEKGKYFAELKTRKRMLVKQEFEI